MHKTPLSMLAVTAAISVMTFAVSAAPHAVCPLSGRKQPFDVSRPGGSGGGHSRRV